MPKAPKTKKYRFRTGDVMKIFDCSRSTIENYLGERPGLRPNQTWPSNMHFGERDFGYQDIKNIHQKTPINKKWDEVSLDKRIALYAIAAAVEDPTRRNLIEHVEDLINAYPEVSIVYNFCKTAQLLD